MQAPIIAAADTVDDFCSTVILVYDYCNTTCHETFTKTDTSNNLPPVENLESSNKYGQLNTSTEFYHNANLAERQQDKPNFL